MNKIELIFEEVLSEGIKHIEDLKPEELLDFLSNWNIEQEKFLVTEKVDGNFLGFGLNNGQFFLRSNNMVFNTKEEIPKLFFMNDFRRYYSLLENVPLEEIISKLAAKYGYPFNGNITISGEAVPSYDHNIVIYDEKKIGDGIFVIFNTEFEGKTFKNPSLWEDLAQEINKHTSVKVFAVPKVDLSKLKFDNDLVVSLEELIKKHGNFLKQPARTPEAKELKAKVLDKVKQIGKTAKQQAIQTKFKSLFGNEYEGIVIATPDGKLVKIVEKDKFTKRKEGNWFYINQLINAQNDFKKAVKASPKSIKQELVKWERELNKIEKDFAKNQDQHITIGKKKEDTSNSINLDHSRIDQMTRMLDQMTPEEVAEKYLSRSLDESAVGNFSFLMKEGGNALEKSNSTVPSEYLETNIKHALKKHGMESIKFSTVGNTSKPFLGDIDIAVDKQQLVQNLDGVSEESFWSDMSNVLDPENSKIIKALNQFHLLSELVDNDGNQIEALDASGESKGEPGFIQIDVFVGNLGWMKDVVSGSPKESKYKAVYRNLFLMSAFSQIKWTSSKNPSVYNKLYLDTKEGFKLVQKQSGPKKDTKISDKVFSVDSDVVGRVLFNKSVGWSDINSFEKLWKLFNGENFRFKSLRADIVEEFKKTLERNKKPFPKELQ